MASVHGVVDRFRSVASRMAQRIESGDRIVFLGNLVGGVPGGEASDVGATIDMALRLRRAAISRWDARACDVVFLRGAQEEMWGKIDQLHFATNPREVLRWMLHRGVGATIAAYGGQESIAEGLRAVGDGPMAIARWTSVLRAAVRARPGHAEFHAAVRRAVQAADAGPLFFNHGIDLDRPLAAQTDAFWWGAATEVGDLGWPWDGIRRLVRGFDRTRPGLADGRFTLTLDGGCGYGGPLLAALLDADGALIDSLRA